MSRYLKSLLYMPSLFIVFSCVQKAGKSEPELKGELGVLLEGNKRFMTHHPLYPHQGEGRIEELASAQHPGVAVISCSDSRVPPELIFDQGLGDLFVVRTAGNLLGGLEIGSIEYAIEHLGVTEILVMGHQGCGAVKAFVEGGTAPGHIRDIVDSIRAEFEIRNLSAGSSHILDQCVKANIHHARRQLILQSAIIAEKLAEKKLHITLACYNTRNGQVELIRE